MIILINIFGAFLVLAGFILIIKPEIVFDLLSENSDKIWLYIGAIVVRMILGGSLIYISSSSKYPLVMLIIGWIAIIAAIVFAVIGWNRFERLMTWVLSETKPFGRTGGVVSVCFGVFLIYVFI